MYTIKIFAEKWEIHKSCTNIFVWFGTRLKVSHVNPLKTKANMLVNVDTISQKLLWVKTFSVTLL